MTTEQQTVPRAAMEEHGAAASGNGRPRVVILGGGVAGLTAAYELRRRLRDRADLTLISDSDRFLLGLSLIWTPLGQRPLTLPLAPALQKHGIRFVHARVEHIFPERRVVLAQYKEIPYDYLLIATGPRADGVAIPGVSGEFNATESIWTEQTAVEAARGLEHFLDDPGPAGVGVAPGARHPYAPH